MQVARIIQFLNSSLFPSGPLLTWWLSSRRRTMLPRRLVSSRRQISGMEIGNYNHTAQPCLSSWQNGPGLDVCWLQSCSEQLKLGSAQLPMDDRHLHRQRFASRASDASLIAVRRILQTSFLAIVVSKTQLRPSLKASWPLNSYPPIIARTLNQTVTTYACA